MAGGPLQSMTKRARHPAPPTRAVHSRPPAHARRSPDRRPGRGADPHPSASDRCGCRVLRSRQPVCSGPWQMHAHRLQEPLCRPGHAPVELHVPAVEAARRPGPRRSALHGRAAPLRGARLVPRSWRPGFSDARRSPHPTTAGSQVPLLSTGRNRVGSSQVIGTVLRDPGIPSPLLNQADDESSRCGELLDGCRRPRLRLPQGPVRLQDLLGHRPMVSACRCPRPEPPDDTLVRLECHV